MKTGTMKNNFQMIMKMTKYSKKNQKRKNNWMKMQGELGLD